MVNSKEIIKEMELGIKNFGEYTFWDKGPEAVMFTGMWTKKFENMAPLEVKVILEEVYDYSEAGEYTARSIVGYLDHMPDEWFDILLSGNKLEY